MNQSFPKIYMFVSSISYSCENTKKVCKNWNIQTIQKFPILIFSIGFFFCTPFQNFCTCTYNQKFHAYNRFLRLVQFFKSTYFLFAFQIVEIGRDFSADWNPIRYIEKIVKCKDALWHSKIGICRLAQETQVRFFNTCYLTDSYVVLPSTQSLFFA